jgi:hypothetical protein
MDPTCPAVGQQETHRDTARTIRVDMDSPIRSKLHYSPGNLPSQCNHMFTDQNQDMTQTTPDSNDKLSVARFEHRKCSCRVSGNIRIISDSDIENTLLTHAITMHIVQNPMILFVPLGSVARVQADTLSAVSSHFLSQIPCLAWSRSALRA